MKTHDSFTDASRDAVEHLLRSPRWFLALSVEERLASLRKVSGEEGLPPTGDVELADARFERWRGEQAFANSRIIGDPQALYGCSESELRVLLGEDAAEIGARSAEPEWLTQLGAAVRREVDWAAPSLLQRDQPDADALTCIRGLIVAAQDELTEHARGLGAGHLAGPFRAEQVSKSLVASLFPALLTILRPALALELNAARLADELSGRTPTERFESFIARLADPARAVAFLHEYPVLARLLVTKIDAWIDACKEFLTRLASDWSEIGREFRGWQSDDELEVVTPSGDPHRGGRRVLLLRFASGFELVYKPRPLAVEAHFQNILDWLNRQTSLLPFRVMKVVDRGDYGWEEFIHQQRCDSREAAANFYKRQGAYLALLRVLGAVDIHFDNIIAAGEHPVLIDLEPLFHRVIPPHHARLRDVERIAAEVTSNSVLYVGLLPYRILYGGPHPGVDLSGMGADAATLMPVQAPMWSGQGTDLMHQELRHLRLGERAHRPLPDTELSLTDFTEDIVEGFVRTYMSLLDHRDELARHGGELERFAHDQTRCLLRPTLAYALMLLTSYHPHFLRDGIVRDRRFDRLIADSERLPRYRQLIGSERRDLWSCDIPAFTTETNSCDISDSSGELLKDFLPETGLEQASRRLEALSEGDLERETWIIQMAIATSAIGAATKAPRLYSVSGPTLPTTNESASRDILLENVQRVAERVAKLALRTQSDATWIGVRSRNGVNWWVDPIGPDLYAGLGGIALFLAYAGKMLDDAASTDLARSATVTMRRQIFESLKRDDALIGGFSGLGGNIYSLMHLAALWSDRELLDDAVAIVPRLPNLIDWDTRFDVVAGAAGCIVPLLDLYRMARCDLALSMARQCGDHLLNWASEVHAGLGWIRPELGPRPLAGFAHGAAGAAWALVRLMGATADPRYGDAAARAINYERTLFSKRQGNWLDLREHHGDSRFAERVGDDTFMSYWCNGSTGIGLARLHSGPLFDDEGREEVRAAVADALRGFGINHSLCHGDLGNMELLIQAQEFLPPDVTPEAVLTRVLESAEDHGWVSGHPHGLESPGLMTGLAGIGLELLRLAHPHDVPCVLLLEPPVEVAPSASESVRPI